MIDLASNHSLGNLTSKLGNCIEMGLGVLQVQIRLSGDITYTPLLNYKKSQVLLVLRVDSLPSNSLI